MNGRWRDEDDGAEEGRQSMADEVVDPSLLNTAPQEFSAGRADVTIPTSRRMRTR
jgi:hypothetical protein